MSSFQSEKEYCERSASKGRIFGVIVLTDNREKTKAEDSTIKNFRSSAFKQTEVDPLEFQKNQFNYTHDLDLIAQLNRRVTDLENRVKVLHELDGPSEEINLCNTPEKKKNRRQFKELIRNQVCPHCEKNYGSQTALKYHVKIKHSERQSYEPCSQ